LCCLKERVYLFHRTCTLTEHTYTFILIHVSSYYPTTHCFVLSRHMLFRTIPPSIVSYYPGTCYFVLSHRALFRTIPAHVISYYPTTHCFVISRHMLFRTLPPHIILYSHTTHCFRTWFGGNRCREVLCTMK